MQTHTRPYGLARRQSYDPLSSTKSQSLSLGTLPRPDFAALPLGQRSVPAVETSRFMASGFRSVSGPHGDGQRTPGGSLVIGSEVFGFGRPPAKDARERWGSGAVMGREEEEDEEEEDAGSTLASKGLDGGAEAGSDWPTEFEKAVTGGGVQAAEFKLTPGQAARSKHSLENLSTDFNLGGLNRPQLKTYGSSADLRSPPNLSSVNDDPPATVNRASASTAAQLASSTRSASGVAVDNATPQSTDSIGLGFASGAISGELPTPAGYPYSTMDPHSYLPQAYGAFQPPRRGQPAFDPSSADDLSAGLRSMNLGNDSFRGAQGGARQQRQVFGNAGGYQGREGPPPPSRQASGGYPAYYLQQGSPYLPQDAYAAYADPGNYFQAAGELQASRRESGHSPSWALPMGMGGPGDFSGQIPSNHTSRHGSFSYSPAPSFGLAPGAPFAPSPEQQHQANTNVGTFPPVMGQQQQILLGRGLRSAVEYIAPGPPVPAFPQYGSMGGMGRYGDEMRPMRSPLLEEFRTNRHRSWELTDLVGHVAEFAGDQLGSRHIQTKLETATSDEKQLVFEEVLPNMLPLSTDVFANYVIQKFFEQGSQAQKTAMAKVLEGHVLTLSLQMYGCRVVQKALEYVLVDQQVRLVKELDGHILKCARDAQSNHVIQRALERVPSEHVTFITDACVGQVHSLATHPYGCRVLQRIFENCPPAQSRGLLDELHRYTQNLIQDQYGNYVIQWVIEKGELADRSLVIAKVYGQVLPLAQQKFASNVIEKCIIWATEGERRRLIEEVLNPGADGSSVVKAMLVHPYANYVMQKMLHTAVGPQREQLFSQTAVQLANLRKYASSYSKHLIAIEKLLSSERGRNLY